MTEPTRYEIQVPEDLQTGVYANLVGVWHSPYEFTLDFAVMQQPVPGERGTVIPTRVVSRVRIPATQVFELIKALNTNMTIYEQRIGPIQSPGQRDVPLFPPDEPSTGG